MRERGADQIGKAGQGQEAGKNSAKKIIDSRLANAEILVSPRPPASSEMIRQITAQPKHAASPQKILMQPSTEIRGPASVTRNGAIARRHGSL